MQTKLLLAVVIAVTFGACYALRAQLAPSGGGAAKDLGDARRIVSQAPSVTETLFALGLGDRVVGVTRYCDYPPEARGRPQTGGVHDPNFEAILALRPDLVVLAEGRSDNLQSFRKLGLPALAVEHRNVEGILESIQTIGRACGAEERAQAIVEDVRVRLDRVGQQTAGRPRPRVLLAVQRTLGTGRVEDVCIAGCDGHLGRIIELAWGQNAYGGVAHFPVVSAEGILRMDPEVIVDLVPGLAGGGVDRKQLAADWDGLARLRAVRSGRVHVLDDDFAFKPGPRFVLLVEKLARLLHPEADWP